MGPIQSTEPGFFGRISNRVSKAVVSWATSHAPIERSVRIQDSNCGKLIKDISTAMSRTVLEGSKNTFAQNGQEEIKEAMDDLMSHVFTTFATEGIDHNDLSDDELTDHFFATIIKKVVTEFEAHPTLDTHTHFKNIAQELLLSAFPKGVQDDKIPFLLRKLLSGNVFLHWIAKRNLGTDQDFSWDGLTTLFATHLENIFSHKAPANLDPAINNFINTLVDKIDSSAKEIDSITVSFPQLSDESNVAISNLFTRIRQGQFSRAEDKELFDKARTWFLGFIRTSLQAVYGTLFACKPGQTPQERRVELISNIAQKAKEILPQAQAALKELAALNDEEALERFGNPKKKAELETVHMALQRILASELQAEKIAQLLPPFISAENAIKQIYDFLAPYLFEILTQCNEIEQKGLEATRELEKRDVSKWLDKGLEYANSQLEAKAANGTFQPTEFAFINELICQGMTGSKNLNTPLKQLIVVIIKEAFGTENPELAIANSIDMILTEGQKAIAEEKDLTETARLLLGRVLSKELFTSLLPPFLRNVDFYEGLVNILKNYLQGLSDQTKKLQALDSRLNVPELQSMLTTITKKASDYASNLLQGEGLKNLAEKALPKIVEAVIAYHVNPKEGITSEKRAAEFFLQCATIAEQGFESGSLEATAETLIDVILPRPLLEQLIPEQFAPFKLDKLLATVSYDYIKSAYEYSQAIRQLSSDQNSSETKMLLDLQKYILTHVRAYFESSHSENKTWIEEVTRQIFTTENSQQKELLMHLTTNIYFGAIGFLFKTSDVSGGNLLGLLEPIAEQAQELFLTLNAKGDLGLSAETISAYTEATGKDGSDKRHVAYWQAARKALDILYSDEEWRLRIPEFLHSVLTKDMAANFATTIYETVHATQVVLQREEAKGIKLVQNEKNLTAFVDSRFTANIIELLQELAKDDKPLNATLPTLLDNFIKECCTDTSTKVGDIRNTLIKRLVYTVMGKLLSDKTPVAEHVVELVKSYKQDNVEISQKLIQIALPKEALDTPLAKLLVSKVVEKELADMIGDVKECVTNVQAEGKRAKEYLYSLSGMKTFVKELIENLDESLLKHAQDKENKLSEDFPEYIDTLLKDCIRNPTVGPVVKKALHNIVYILLEETLTPKLGQTIENRLSEMLSELSFKKILPEHKLKSLLPGFLKNAVTHEKLMKWFFAPYVKQIEETNDKIAVECAKPIDPRVHPFIKKTLLAFTAPTATSRGLLGYEGVVRELERTFITSQIDQPILEATVGQVTRNLEARGFLDPNFLTEALSGAFDAEELPQDGAITKAVLAAALPGGKASLLVPDVAKDAVWQKATESITKIVDELTDPNKRLLFAIERLIPFTTGDKVLIGKRQQQIEDMRRAEFNPKIAESCFKRYTQEAALRSVELAVEKENLWGPFKWLKTAILKTVTFFTVRFSLANRFYNFLINPKSNDTIKKMVWSIVQGKRSDKDLKESTKKLLGREGLAPFGLQGFLASQIASLVKDKTILDIVT